MARTFMLLLLTCAGFVDDSIVADEPRDTQQAERAAEEPIDFDRARELFRRRQRGDTLTADEEAYLQRAIKARNAQGNQNSRAVPQSRESTGMIPVSHMTADER